MQKLSNSLKIPAFSSGDLISEKNGEKYGANKTVKNKEYNQRLLVNAVNEKTNESPELILAGHFCIFNEANEVELLPEFVFENLHLSKIVLLEATANTIIDNLNNRDNKKYSIKDIKKLIESEKQQANIISSRLGVPLFTYTMSFDESDLDKTLSFIRESDT